jgi:hypothetical protein
MRQFPAAVVNADARKKQHLSGNIAFVRPVFCWLDG